MIEIGTQAQATNARSIGNYGLWETLRRARDADTYDEDDENLGRLDPDYTTRWVRWRGRIIGWSVAAGVLLAYVNHWPGGH